MRKLTVVVVGLLVAALILTACPAPTPQIIEVPKEVVVEKKVVETIEVVKEVAVEKIVKETVEVVVEIEKEVVVTATPEPLPTPVVAEEPEYGGTIYATFVADPPSLGDPPPSWDGSSWMCHMLLYNGLLRFKQQPSQDVEPELAEALPTVSPDGKVFTFKLREGLKFSSGRPLTAEDVKWSLDRMLDDETQGWGVTYYMGIKGAPEAFSGEADGVEGIRVIDDLTIEIEMSDPIAPDWFMKLMTVAWTYVVDREAVEQWGEEFRVHPAGSGPYVLAEYTPGQMLVFEKNPNYWRQPDEPYADRIEIELSVDTSVAALKLEKGEIDLAASDPMSPAALRPFLENPAWAPYIDRQEDTGAHLLALDASEGLTADLRVRQAIAYAIDKERMIAITGGNAIPAKTLLAPGSGEWYDPTMPEYEYSPEKAKALLEEAGVAEGTTIEFWSANYYPWAEIGQAIQYDLSQIGLDVQLHLVQRAAWYEANANHNPLVVNQWPLELPDPAYIFDGGFTCAAMYPDSCCNWSWICTDEMEAKLAAARQEQDKETRIGMYHALDRQVSYDEVLWIPLYSPEYIWVHSPRLGGFEVSVVYGPGTVNLSRMWVVGGG